MIEGTWILLVEDEPYDPAKNQRIMFAGDGSATLIGKSARNGRYEIADRHMRFDFTDVDTDGNVMHGAIVAQVDSERAASMSGSLYWSAIGIPVGIGDIGDPDDETADELWCDPCLLVREDAAARQFGV